MNLNQVPHAKGQGRKRNPERTVIEQAADLLVQVPTPCEPRDCHFCKMGGFVAHAAHITTADYEAGQAEFDKVHSFRL